MNKSYIDGGGTTSRLDLTNDSLERTLNLAGLLPNIKQSETTKRINP